MGEIPVEKILLANLYSTFAFVEKTRTNYAQKRVRQQYLENCLSTV